MKKFIFLFLIFFPSLCYSQIEFSHNYLAENMWGGWNTAYGKRVSVTQNGFVIHNSGSHPSEWFVKVTYSADSDKKRINTRYKSKEWEKIPCTVIFRHASGFYNLKDLMQLNFKEGSTEERHVGRIWIAPYKYKKGMRTFNIFIGDYGAGISLTSGTIIWKK